MGFSPLAGEIVTVRGKLTFPPGLLVPQYTSIYLESDDCGLNVFVPVDWTTLPYEFALGDSFQITGEVEEYISATTGAGAVTEIVVNPSNLVELSTGYDEPEPALLTVGDCYSEDNEGRLVRTVGVIVVTNYDWSMDIEEPWSGDRINIYQGNNPYTDFSVFDLGDTLDVTGIITQYDQDSPYFDGYEIVPRFQSDLQHAVPPEPPPPTYWPNATIDAPAAVFNPDVGEVLPIEYAAPDGSRTKIEVFDLQGRSVRILTDETYYGESTLPEYYRQGFYGEGINGWDGRDDLRRIVSAGTYVCRPQVTEEDGGVSYAVTPAVVAVRLD